MVTLQPEFHVVWNTNKFHTHLYRFHNFPWMKIPYYMSIDGWVCPKGV